MTNEYSYVVTSYTRWNRYCHRKHHVMCLIQLMKPSSITDVLSPGQENKIVALVARGRMFMLSTVDELKERSRYKRVGFKRDYADYPL